MIENKKKASKLKEKGNDAFKKKKYEVAEKFYSEALQLNLDSRPIWTNRAISYITTRTIRLKVYEIARDLLVLVAIYRGRWEGA